MKTKTQFTNRILSLVLSIMMVVSMLPASALSVFAAEGDKVSVTINGETTYYTSIKDAVAKANESGNATITLLQDTTTGERLDITNSATLDLNGNTLSCTAYFADDYETMVAITTNNTKLTIIDSVGGGKLDGTGTDYALMLGEPGAYTARSASAYIDGSTVSGSVKTVSGTSMTVSGSTVESNSVVATIDMTNETTLNVFNSQILNTHSSSTAPAIDNSGTLTITDSTVSGSIGVDNRGTANISGNTNITGTVCSVKSWVESQDSTLTITGGSYTGGIDISGGTATISGGSYTGGIVVSGGTATISDGTITESRSNKENAVEVSGSADLTISGGTFSATAGETYDTGVYVHDGGTVKIIGGTITSRAYGVYNDGGSATITGGTISGGTVDLQVVGSDSILNLTLDEGKTVGATFPGGITAEGITLAELLATDTVAYWGVVDGKDTMLTVADAAATGITDKGDITIRAKCDHKDVKLDYITTETTHTPVCSVCNWTGKATEHTGGTATCQAPAVCEACGVSYGDLDANIHTPTEDTIFTVNDNGTHSYTCACGTAVAEVPHTLDVTTGKCVCGADMTAIATVTDSTNTYYAADAATLNQAVTAILETGSRTFTVELPADAEAEMITAIRRAICDTEGVADGSINLTLKGVTSIPGTTNWDGVAFGPRNAQWDENNVEIVSHEEVTQLASVNLPDVTEIGAQAFLDCSNLTSITAPKVQFIGDWGLQGTAITSIDMPLLKEAGYSAFCRTALTEVSLPSLETAGVIVFGHCEQLRTVDLPKLQNLSQQLFTRCTSLVSVSAPAATSMGINVFKGCSELVSITLPGVTELTYEAFAECTKLENITLGSVITSVNVNLFGSDSSLSSNITLTLNCGQEKAETLPAAAGTNVEWAGFTWKEVKFAHSYVDGKCTACGEDCAHTGGTATCTTLAVCDTCGASYGEVGGHSPDAAGYTVNADGTHSYTCSSCGNPFTERHTFTDGACTGCGVIGGYCGEEGNEQNVIWTYANGTLTISGTGAMADQFDNYNNRPWEEYVDQITTIVVNDGITSIGEAAFWRFQKLTTAKLPDSLTTISQQAFYGCTALKTVNFPANLKTIEGWAFLGCALESVTLPEGLTTIGYRAFSECKNLTSVTVPASVTTIDEGAFGYSPAKITVAEDNLNYSSDEHGVLFDKDKTTLIYCRPNIEVETYTIPSTVTEICKEAFYGCKNLATITIPDGVQKIGSSAFGSCEALTTITIPAGVTTIEANTFYNCTALTAVTIPAGVTTIDMWAFSGCTALTTVTIPASATSIAYNAFSNCSALTTVNVPCTWDDSLYTFDEGVTVNKVHNWVGGACTVCGVPCDHKDSTHTTATDNGDGTHSFECSVCVNTVIEDHTGGTATCTEQAECQHCGASYGDFAAHSMDYVADEEANTITYRCGTCDTKTVTYTLVIPTGVVYGSSAMAVPHYDCSDKTYQGDSPEITLDGALLKDFVPGAKTYEVVMTWGGKTVSGEYTIAKAEVSIATAPTPNSGLTYIGEAQYLISAGEAVGGTMVYSLTENGEYTTSIPQGTNAGDYTVWYYVQGDANHNDSAKDSVSVTIAKATPTAEDFIFTAPTDLIYDGTAKPATITVKDGIVGMGEVNIIYFRDASMWIDNEREPIYPGRYKVGIWIKEGDNYNAVYSNERIWLGDEFEIKYLTTDAKAVISGTVGSNGWYTSDVTLTAPEGYQISKTKYNDGFVSELTFSAEQNETITYYLKDANGDVAEKTVELKIDKTAPAAQYQIGTDGWKQFINTITFGLFCKDYKTVDIEYTDDLSGVAEKQYYISSEEITNTSRIAWLDYTDTLSLNATGKYFIYMRVVDNAGNEVILNTEGIVIYEDSIQVTESVSATYNAGTDKAVTVKLNGNTVNAIQNGNAVLTAGTDYTVSADGTITLKASYLDALKAGEYTFTVSYDPQGVETDKVNMTTAFTVKVEKADGKVSNLNISSKTYDGTAVTAPTFDKLGDGAATIEYKLSDADDNTYTTTAPKDAGNYVVRVTVAEGTNHKKASATTYFAIASAELRDVSVQQNGKLTYNGQAQTPTVSTSVTTVDGSKVTFTYGTEMEGPYSTEIPSFTNVGWAHTVFYRATADNHNTYYGSFLVEIEKAAVTEPTIASKPYTGSAQTADISDTDLYTVEKNNGGTEKGSYDVVLKLKDSANYKWSTTDNAEVTLQFVISAAQNAWDTNPSISGWTYGEAAKTPVGTAKYGAVKVVYTGKEGDGTDYNSETAPTKAGNYTATFTVTGTEAYSGLSEQVNFTIAKKAVTVTANDAGKTYGESDPALTYTHTELVGSDALVITVARASGENANTYTITASQAEGANPNYEITFKTGTFTIHKETLNVMVEDKTATYGDPVLTYTVKYEGFKNGDDKDDLGGALAFECGYTQFSDKGEYTIKASGYTSGNYTISYVDGKLTVNSKPITVTIQNATSVYGDTLAELKATDNGIVNGDTNVYGLATTATGTSNVGKYAITGTALDSNYDVTFVNGEYEITKREITITVDAKNTVVNTTLPTYTYKVEGLVGVDTLVAEPTLTCNANIAVIGEYDITATGADAGGNYSIKYVPAKLTVLTDNAVDAAAGYTEELKNYDPATVTSEDKAELEEMLSEINTILGDETTTDNGKKALEEVKEQVEKLIKEINDAAGATDTENTEKVEDVTPENVTPEDKTDLEGAKADLEKALEDNGGNYTEDEKKAIEDEIKRIDDALKVIGNVEAVEKVISKLPAVDTVKPDDEEAIKAITDAQTAYNALSDYEKSLVDEATKAALDKLAAALVAYDIVEGDGSSWTEDSEHNITFVANGLFSKFVGIKVDGKDVDKANYEVNAGSTIITLNASYMDTLAVGEHTISVVYTDGSTDGTFNVRAKANSPATGDDFNIALYCSLVAVSVTALVVLLLVSKKRGQAR